MKNLLFRFILPLAFLFLAYSLFGSMGLLTAVVLYLAAFIYLNRSMLLQSRAGKKYQRGDFQGALADLENAVLQSPKQYKTRGTYAYLLLKLGNTEKAAEEIAKAMEMCQTQADKNPMLITYSLVLWKQDKVDEAVAILEELLKTYQTTNAYGTLGFLYIQKGDYDKALSFNLEAYDYNSSNTIILDNLGMAYYLKQDYDKALEIYKELMTRKPTFPEAFYNYGLVLEHFGEYEEALYMFRTAQTLKFWNVSTITREQVDEAVQRLDAKCEEIGRAAREKKLAEAAALSAGAADTALVDTASEAEPGASGESQSGADN